MTSVLRRDAPIPLHYQLKQALLARIAKKELSPGDRLPSEAELSKQYSISRTTVRHALGQMVSEGHIERRQGSGTFVAIPRISQWAELTSFTDTLERQGLQPSRTVLVRDTREAPLTISAELQLEGDASRCLFIERLLLANEEPVGLAQTWLPLERIGTAADLISLDRLENESLYQILKNPPVGIVLQAGTETIRAEKADAEHAVALKCQEGDPILLVHRVAFAASGQPFESTKLQFSGQTYQYRVALSNGISESESRTHNSF